MLHLRNFGLIILTLCAFGSCKTSESALTKAGSQLGSWQLNGKPFSISDKTLKEFRVCSKASESNCLSFSPGKEDFSWSNALVLSMLSHIVYDKEIVQASTHNPFSQSKTRDSDATAKIVKSWGFEDYKFYDDQNNEYAIVKHDKFIVVVFRGSNSFRDWIQNFTVFNKNIGNIKNHIENMKQQVLHRGYMDAADKIVNELGLASSIKKMLPAGKTLPIWFTGHSNGGAMAIASALMLAKKNEISPSGVMTFGAPKIMNKSLAREYENSIPRSWRIIHGKDPVVAVPRFLGLLQARYEWETKPIFIASGTCKVLSKWPLLNRLFPVIGPGFWEHGLQDHRLRNYIECLHLHTHLR